MNLRRIGSGLLSTGQLLSIVSLAIAGGLMVWAALPLAIGWSTHAVASGSMTPQIQVGDLLVADRTPAADVEVGEVVLFKDPSEPDRMLSHRVTKINDDGSLVTKGDANPTADLMPVPTENVIGVAKLRIPWIGYPSVWFGNGNYGLVLLTLLGLAVATALAVWPDKKTDEEAPAGAHVTEPWHWLVHMRTH
jgi:signal peptidase I